MTRQNNNKDICILYILLTRNKVKVAPKLEKPTHSVFTEITAKNLNDSIKYLVLKKHIN
jgi:hypothetical protein